MVLVLSIALSPVETGTPKRNEKFTFFFHQKRKKSD